MYKYYFGQKTISIFCILSVTIYRNVELSRGPDFPVYATLFLSVGPILFKPVRENLNLEIGKNFRNKINTIRFVHNYRDLRIYGRHFFAKTSIYVPVQVPFKIIEKTYNFLQSYPLKPLSDSRKSKRKVDLIMKKRRHSGNPGPWTTS